jgi:hypothetical protein
MDGGLIVAVCGSDVSDDEETVLRAVGSAGVGGVCDVRLGPSITNGVMGATKDSALGVDLSVPPGAEVDKATVMTGASCWRGLANWAWCATLKKP